MEDKVLVAGIKLLHQDAVLPCKNYMGDAGYDLTTVEDVVLGPRSFTDVHTGISMSLPHGYFARITGRSSTLRKLGLLISEGIIDNEFTGELFVGAFNMNSRVVTVKAGSRIAQMIVQEIVQVHWTVVKELPQTKRGNKGFGSTGG